MNARILLVEDNEQNRYLATFLLEKGGHTVIHATNGRRALELFAEEKPDLILMDIQMPEMDGYAAAKAIFASAGDSPTPIVAVTSYAMAGDRERALAMGFAGYIEKPIETETFLDQINRYLHPQ